MKSKNFSKILKTLKSRGFKKIELDRDIRYLTKLVSVLGLEIWLRVFVTKELNANKKL